MKETSRYIVYIIGAGVLVYLGLRGSFGHNDKLVPTSAKASIADMEVDATTPNDEPLDSEPLDSTTPVTTDMPAVAVDSLSQYQKSFQEMGQCFDIPIAGSRESVPGDLTPDTLQSMITPSQGDVVNDTDEWGSADIKMANGDIRRILVQNYTDDPESEAGKKLSYSTVTADGRLIELPLSDEQKRDPSESLVASLETDGQVVSRSRSRRIFYQSGGDLSYTEKDGNVVGYEYSLEGKTFRCANMDSQNISCRCF
jgi:hypothetical protein